MDNLAHTLAGAALGEAGLKRRTALAMPTLLIGANLPDIDVVVLLFGSGLSFRRGWTHGILALVVLPLLLTAGMILWDRHVRRRRSPGAEAADARQLLLLSSIAVLSHPFLDYLNTYGLRWLMPFDGRWFYGDALFIIDPWIWLMLLGGVNLARRRQSSTAGGAAVAMASLYIALMLMMGTGGRLLIERELHREGFAVEEVMVGPVPVNANRRYVVMRRGDFYYRGDLRWLPRPRLVVSEQTVRTNKDHPVAQVAATYPQAEDFLAWSRFPFYKIERLGRGYRVILDDFRYSSGREESWAAVEVILRDGTPPGGGSFTAAERSETSVELGT